MRFYSSKLSGEGIWQQIHSDPLSFIYVIVESAPSARFTQLGGHQPQIAEREPQITQITQIDTTAFVLESGRAQ